MEKGVVYRITKLEKGPLQRFKNQNALIKKFGDVGIVVYKAISGKKTNMDLEREVEVDSDVLFQVLSFMETESMVELSPLEGSEKPAVKETPTPPEETATAPQPEISHEEEPVAARSDRDSRRNREILPTDKTDQPKTSRSDLPKEEASSEITPVEEELKFEKPEKKQEPELKKQEEEPAVKEAQPEFEKQEEEKPAIKETEEEKIAPSEDFEITPIEEVEKKPNEPARMPREATRPMPRESVPAEQSEGPRPKKPIPEPEEPAEEITPVGAEEPTPEAESEKETPTDASRSDRDSRRNREILPTDKTDQPEEETPVAPAEEYLTQELKMEESEQAPPSEEDSLSPVEKIIKDKYGDLGIKVYQLIDGQRTAEEIMKETGLSESKLVEMLDFMDDEGIIKLEYPGDKKKKKEEEVPAEKPAPESDTFKPMVEGDEAVEKDLIGKNPIETPVKTPLNMVEALYVRADTLRKFGGKGGKILESIDGKKDIIELAIENGLALFEVKELMDFLLTHHVIMLKPLGRVDIRKKYGDDGYSVYKRYGKDGVFLYELVGKDMKIKDMVKLVYRDVKTNREKLADMFVFIHQVLKIDLPVDRELLYREFGA